MSEHLLPPARHETRDVTFRFVSIAFGGLLLGLIGSGLVAAWLYPQVLTDHRVPAELPRFPAPRLQANPPADLRAFLAQEHARLDGTGWVDQAHGIAHIPIDDAMRRIAHDGIPDWPTK